MGKISKSYTSSMNERVIHKKYGPIYFLLHTLYVNILTKKKLCLIWDNYFLVVIATT